MSDTIIGILIGAGITLVTTWLNQKGETRRLKKQLKHECLKEEINELRATFDKFKQQIWKSYEKKAFSVDLHTEIVSLYPEKIRKQIASLIHGAKNKEFPKFKSEVLKIFREMNTYIVKRRKEIIDEI